MDPDSTPAGLTIDAQPTPGSGVVLALAGYIDLSNVQVLSEAITKAVAHARDITLDLTKVTFLDSTGLREFASGYHQAEAAGVGFRVANPEGSVLDVLRISGMYDYLTEGVHPG
ncbi:STAS domain-containing protein [Luedemannella helvata]|uniref:Anti-sigma factor antagonist n=1 Tax=Luedemannella helvata TaxID=349315 RepID=A0ABN2KBL7_9ACTN